ncbi:MAG: hypothetical protein NC489_30140 [Ruminococcus flavefaciens]|nr:hypothetical protein [Ruminococcus flavefaciens]
MFVDELLETGNTAVGDALPHRAGNDGQDSLCSSRVITLTIKHDTLVRPRPRLTNNKTVVVSCHCKSFC